MALRMISMVLLCTCLQGCFAFYVCNPDAACLPFPEFSAEDHDDVCPDITGVYANYTKDEYSSSPNTYRTDPGSLDFKTLGKEHIKVDWKLARELKVRPAIPAELSASSSEVVHISNIMVSFRRMGDNMLERVAVDQDGMLRTIIHIDTSPSHRACDKGRAFYQFNARTSGEFGTGAGKAKLITVISKDSTGDVIQQEYMYKDYDLNLNPLSFFTIGASYELKLYRFKKLSDTPIMLPEGFVFPK